MKLFVVLWAVSAFLLCAGPVWAEKTEDIMVEETTESPNADMALEDDAVNAPTAMKIETHNIKPAMPLDSKQHTIADFIIHPLIALKPRTPQIESAKQANNTSSVAPSPWQLFNFSPGQGLGSLAGTVTGWLGNRIQLPGLVDTPVREPSTTTTARPAIIVRIQQRPSTKKPSTSISNNNNRPYRKNNRPNRFYGNYVDYLEENEGSHDYYDFGNFNRKRGNRRRYQAYEYGNNDDENASSEQNEDDEETGNGENDDSNNYSEEEEAEENEGNNRKRLSSPTKNINNHRRRLINQQRKQPLQEIAEEDQYDENNYDYDYNNEYEDFYHNKNQQFKRYQNDVNFISRGQQRKAPAAAVHSLRKSGTTAQNKLRQPATLVINSNGQTFYIDPELLQVADKDAAGIKHYSFQSLFNRPLKRRDQTHQYVAIPWSQLRVLPHKQNVSHKKDVGTQRLILKIPPSVVDGMQNVATYKRRTNITPNAVPLLAEADIKDVLKPSQPPLVRTSTTNKPVKKPSQLSIPAVVANHIRPAPVEEISTANEDSDKNKNSDESTEDDNESTQFIVVADEPPIGRKLSPSAYRKILNYINRNREGRQLNSDSAASFTTVPTKEQQIPVQILTTDEKPLNQDKLDVTTESEMAANNFNKTKLEKLNAQNLESSTSL